MLQFLGDVNLFHGRFGHGPGGIGGDDAGAAEVSYVRPHELQILATPEEGTLAVTLSQVLMLGAQARIEFRREDDGSYVDVEMPRIEFAALRRRLGLETGSRAHLKPRRVTRFAALPADQALVTAHPSKRVPGADASAWTTTSRFSGDAKISMKS